MKRVEVYQDRTGTLHRTLDRAQHATSEAYGANLKRLAWVLVECGGKIGPTLQALDKLVESGDLALLLALYADQKLEFSEVDE